MRQHGSGSGFIGMLLLLGMLATAGWAAPTEGITFTFAPPNGIKYEEQKTTTATIALGEMNIITTIKEAANTRINLAETGYQYEAKSGGITQNFVLKGIPEGKSEEASQKMKEAMNPFVNLLSGVVLTSTVDTKGNLIYVEGADALRQRLQEKAPPEMANLLQAAITDDMLLQHAKVEWEQRAQRFIGRTVSVGSLWIDTAEIASGMGMAMPMYRATKVIGWEQRQGRDVLRVRTWCHNTPAGLAKMIGKTAAEVTAATKPINNPNTSDITITGDQLIEPSTLLCYAEGFTTKTSRAIPFAEQQQKTISVSVTVSSKLTYY